MAPSKQRLGNHKGKGIPSYGKKPPQAPRTKHLGKATKANGRWTPRKPAGAATGTRKGNKYAQVYTDAMIADALRRSNGLRTHAAALLGMNATQICLRINKTPELLKVCDEAKESLLDTCETGLRMGAKKGKGWAVMFGLDRLGHKRGYMRPELGGGGTGGSMGVGGIPTDLTEWPKADLDRLIAVIANRLAQKDETGAFA